MNSLFITFETWWQLTRVSWQIMRGTWRLLSVEAPYITIFGSARVEQHNQYAKMAYELARMLIKEDISIVTGGNMGIMQAANCGAFDSVVPHKKRSIGITMRKLHEKNNDCVQDAIGVDFFFARKWLMMQYAQGLIFFPGGYGTLDELFNALLLMQTGELQRVPIALVGVDYWTPLITWFNTKVIAHNMLAEGDLSLFMLSDDLQEVCCFMRDACKKMQTKG